jgi:hypothetical protein
MLRNIIVFTSLLISCQSRIETSNELVTDTTGTSAEVFSTSCIRKFEQFREAVSKKDNVKLKSYFNFPLDTEGEEIWYVVLDSAEYENKDGNFARLFTENDFDIYHQKLFPDYFITGLMKLNTKEIFTAGESETKRYEQKNIRYKMSASLDTSENLLTLNLASEADVFTGKDEIHKMESNLIYYFHLSKDCRLKFIRMLIAG